jgi:hypothetical protein
VRERHTDEQLIALIRENRDRHGSSASRMLRHFRNGMGIACEQRRFAELFARAQTEMDTAP